MMLKISITINFNKICQLLKKDIDQQKQKVRDKVVGLCVNIPDEYN